MRAVAKARRRVRLRLSGSSRSIVLPKAWLRDMGVSESVDEVKIAQTSGGILVQAPQGILDIEQEPEFAHFLAFLAKDALAHPEQLGNVGDLVAGDDDLTADFAANLAAWRPAHGEGA